MHFPVVDDVFFGGKLWVSEDTVVFIRNTHGIEGDLMCILPDLDNFELWKKRLTQASMRKAVPSAF